MTYVPYQFVDITVGNNGVSTVAGGSGGIGTSLNPSDTTLHLPTSHGARFPASGYFMIQIGTNEYAKSTLNSADTLTIVRAQESTSAGTWPVGTTVQAIVSAQALNDGMNELATLDSAKAALSGAAFTGNISTTGTATVTGAATLSSTLAVSSTSTLTGAVSAPGGFSNVKGIVPTGIGLPVLVGVAENTAVSVTTQQTILTLTSPNDGNNHTYMAHAWVDLNNGTSGQNLILRISYTDPRSAGTPNLTPFSTATGTASQSFNGSVSVVNGRYACYPYSFTVKANTAVSIIYQDPANTPNDHVTAMLYQLT